MRNNVYFRLIFCFWFFALMPMILFFVCVLVCCTNFRYIHLSIHFFYSFEFHAGCCNYIMLIIFAGERVLRKMDRHKEITEFKIKSKYGWSAEKKRDTNYKKPKQTCKCTFIVIRQMQMKCKTLRNTRPDEFPYLFPFHLGQQKEHH